jgi:hypothetical protein
MSTAVEAAFDLNAVSDDFAATVLAHRCQPMRRTLETIEDMMLSSRNDFERLVVLVPAHLTLTHRRPPPLGFIAVATRALGGTRDHKRAYGF